MATVPTTQTIAVGEKNLAAEYNSFIRDALAFLLSPPRCSLYQTATTNMSTSGTASVIAFDTELYDTDSMHSTSSNTSRITCNAAGLYLVTATLGFAANATGFRRLDLRKNGSATPFATVSHAAAPTLSSSVSISEFVQLSVGDYIEMFGTQTSGGALASVAGADWTNFAAQWVANS